MRDEGEKLYEAMDITSERADEIFQLIRELAEEHKVISKVLEGLIERLEKENERMYAAFNFGYTLAKLETIDRIIGFLG